MRLISIEDYAKWHSMSIQEAYALTKEGKLTTWRDSKDTYNSITFVYVKNVPSDIPSLDANTHYLSQQQAAHKLKVSVPVIRKRIRLGEFDSVVIKRKIFIPEVQISK